MRVKVISFIPYLKNINEEYYFDQQMTLEEFLIFIGIRWDEDVLVVINRNICTNKSVQLNDGDTIELLIPISGG